MLVELIKKASDLSKKIQKSKDFLDKQKSLLLDLKKRINEILKGGPEIEAESKKIQKEIAFCELEVRELEDFEADRRRQLEKETELRAMRALELEIKDTAFARAAKESRLEKLCAARGRLTTVNHYKKRLMADEVASLQGELNKQTLLMETLSDEDLRLNDEGSVFLNSIPADIKARIGIAGQSIDSLAAAPMKSGLCGACFYPISTIDLGLLSKKKVELIDCKSCYKKVYLDEETVNGA